MPLYMPKIKNETIFADKITGKYFEKSMPICSGTTKSNLKRNALYRATNISTISTSTNRIRFLEFCKDLIIV